jgi:hypothetical protein
MSIYKLGENMEQWERELAEIRAIMKESAKEREERAKEHEKSMKELAEMRKQQKETNEMINGIGDSNGKFSETYFYNSLYNSMCFGGKDFDEIEEGMNRVKKMPDGNKLKGEYDVVMYNGDTVALIEIKYKVRKGDIETLTDTQVNVFKQLFPQYANYKFYLGIAGMSFEGNTETEALRRGIGIMRPKCENGEIINKDLKVY